MRIGVTGQEFFTNLLVEFFVKEGFNISKVNSSLFTYREVSEKDIIFFIYSPTTSLFGFLQLLRLKIFRKKIIVLWIGSDVLFANVRLIPRILTKIAKNLIDVNLVISPWLAKELNLIGLKIDGLAKLPLNCDLHSTLSLHIPPKILIYLPKGRYLFFKGEVIEDVIRSFLEIEFWIVGDGGQHLNKYKNVKILGWVRNMDRIYEDILVLIRIPIHDGMSTMVLEALSKGRHIIWSYKFPYCRTAKTGNEIMHHLSELLSFPALNYEGAEWVRKNYADEKILKKYNYFFEMAINK